MTHCIKPVRTALALACVLAASAAQAQATVKPDGQFRASLGLGASNASGNTKSSALSLNADGVRATDQDKLSLFANAQYAKSNGNTTSEQFRLGSRYDRNIDTVFFGFGGAELERNKFANLKLRGSVNGGIGYHAVKTETTTFDLFGGLGYSSDKYITPAFIDKATRSRYSYLSLMLAEESTHKLSDSTSFKQRLVVLPNLNDTGEFRANWNAGLAVAMSKALSLNVGFNVEHNSQPGAGRKSTDTLLTTGISVKFD